MDNTINLNNNLGGNIQPPVFTQSVVDNRQEQVNLQAAAQTVIPSTSNVVSEVTVNNIQPVSVGSGSIPVQQPVNVVNTTAIPYTPENPTNVGVVTNTVQPITSNVQNVIQPNITAGLAQTMEQPVQQPVVNNTVNSTQPVQPIVQDRFIVSVDLLKKLVSNAKKVGIFDVYVPLSQVLDLTMDKNGITMITSNGQESYKCVDNTYVYTDILKCVVDISLFGDLVAALEGGDVEFTIDDNNVLTLHTGTGKFKFSERINIDNGQPLHIDIKFEQPYEEMTSVDYTKLVEIINHTKPARSAATSMDSIKGIYFSDIIICSDQDIILMQQNLDNIQDKNFFISSSFSDLICSIDFDTEKFRLGFVKNEMNQVVGLILCDGRTTICGNVQPDTQLPVDSCREYWKQQFPNTISLDTNKCLKVLKKVKPFIKQGTESDATMFNILGDTLQIESLQGDAQDSIEAKNINSYVTKLRLSIVKMLDILQTVNSPTFDITIDPQSTNYICLSFDNFKCIMGLANDTQA